MRKPSDDLFKLVRSLSKEEARFFKKFIQRNNKSGKNNALRLFMAIHAQAVYDEEQIKEEFMGDAIGKHLPAEKNYLLRSILKAMRVQKEEEGVDNLLRGLLTDLRFLIGKDLPDLFAKTMRKAKRIALQSEKQTILLELYYLERSYIKKLSTKGTKEELEAIHSKAKKLMGEMNELWAYAELNDLSFLNVRRDLNARDKETRERMQALSKHPLLQRDKPAASFQSRIHFYSFKSSLAQYDGEMQDVIRFRRQLLQEYEDAPQMMENYPGEYIRDISTFLSCCHLANQWSDFPQWIDKIRQTQVHTRADKVVKINSSLLLETTYSFATLDFDRALRLQPILRKELEEIAPLLHRSGYFAHLYNMGVLNLLYSDWEKASSWLHKIYQHPPSEQRVDIQQAALILLVIAHHELEDMTYVDALYRSFKRFLSKHESVGRFDKVMKSFLGKMALHGAGPAVRPYVEELHKTLSEINADKAEPNALGMEEVMYWCEAKLEGCEMREVILRKQ